MSSMRRELSAELLKKISERFEFHGKNIYGNPASENNSPLYAHLCLESTNEPEILSLVGNADFATQISNLLFAAVQYLLLKDSKHPLAAFYPNLSEAALPIVDAYPYFRAFCIEHAEEIKGLVESQRVQTNEVGRCAGLLPAFQLVAQRGEGKPLTLLEIGASAGLLLLWDSYCYNYESMAQVGNPSSSVQLSCEIKGAYQPPITNHFPSIGKRLGLELNPIDLSDDNAIRWLEALIWPEHQDRRRLLKAALGLAKEHSPQIIGGNAAETLPEVLGEIADDTTLCVFHSYTFAQMPRKIQEEIHRQLIEHSKQRSLFRISQEWLDGWEKPRLELFHYHQGEVQSELLAYTESHGRWLEWLHA
jgi:hypothetical protein